MSKISFKETSSLTFVVISVAVLSAVILFLIRWSIYQSEAPSIEGGQKIQISHEDRSVRDQLTLTPKVDSDSKVKNIKALVWSKEPVIEKAVKKLPGSLAGVDEPRLTVDDFGRLVLDKNLKNLFEHYLLLTGEEPLADIVERIKYSLSEQLPVSEQSQALRILEGYLGYLNYISDLRSSEQFHHDPQAIGMVDMSEIRHAHQQIREARSLFLSTEVQAIFFSASDSYDNYMLARSEIVLAADIAPDEKQQRLILLEDEMPPILSKSHQEQKAFELFIASENVLSESLMSRNDQSGYGQEFWGEERGQRLSALTAQRNAWNRRVEQYRSELHQMVSTDDNSFYLIAQLRQNYFEGPELLRIASLDKIELGI